jgi:hypothetical protein
MTRLSTPQLSATLNPPPTCMRKNSSARTVRRPARRPATARGSLPTHRKWDAQLAAKEYKRAAARRPQVQDASRVIVVCLHLSPVERQGGWRLRQDARLDATAWPGRVRRYLTHQAARLLDLGLHHRYGWPWSANCPPQEPAAGNERALIRDDCPSWPPQVPGFPGSHGQSCEQSLAVPSPPPETGQVGWRSAFTPSASHVRRLQPSRMENSHALPPDCLTAATRVHRRSHRPATGLARLTPAVT